MDYTHRFIRGREYKIVGPMLGIDSKLHCPMRTYFIERGSSKMVAERTLLGKDCSVLFIYMKKPQKGPVDKQTLKDLDEMLQTLRR